jgi:hypothetical protein
MPQESGLSRETKEVSSCASTLNEVKLKKRRQARHKTFFFKSESTIKCEVKKFK